MFRARNFSLTQKFGFISFVLANMYPKPNERCDNIYISDQFSYHWPSQNRTLAYSFGQFTAYICILRVKSIWIRLIGCVSRLLAADHLFQHVYIVHSEIERKCEFSFIELSSFNPFQFIVVNIQLILFALYRFALGHFIFLCHIHLLLVFDGSRQSALLQSVCIGTKLLDKSEIIADYHLLLFSLSLIIHTEHSYWVRTMSRLFHLFDKMKTEKGLPLD